MKKSKEPTPITRLCHDHTIKTGIQAVYPHDQVCLLCLDEKVGVLWDHVSKQINPKYWENY